MKSKLKSEKSETFKAQKQKTNKNVEFMFLCSDLATTEGGALIGPQQWKYFRVCTSGMTNPYLACL